MTAYKPETVLITGATGGFGQAMAQSFSRLGSRLVLWGRNQEKLQKLTQSLDTPCHSDAFDIRDANALQKAFEAIPEDFSAIDLLVNNAGLALGLEPAHKADIDDWTEMVETNITSLIRLTRMVLPGMVAKHRGHIVNIGSMAGNYPYPGGNVYCASKAFVKQFSLALRADLAKTGIRVTNIEPGLAQTGFAAARFKGDEDKASAVYAGTKPLTGSDVAATVLFVATLPEHVNVNRLEVMPTVQSFGPLPVERYEE